MITFGICLIYYGIALWIYQINGWVTTGNWKPYPLSTAWEAFFGAFSVDSPVLRSALDWLMAWPLSLFLILCGLAILGTVLGLRRLSAVRRHRQRRKWLIEQCRELGYLPWTMSKVLSELDEGVLSEKKAAARKARGRA